MNVKCQKCGVISTLPDSKVPIGRSFMVCPCCRARINIFKGVSVGSVVQNLVGLRYLGNGEAVIDRFCEPGELWRVIQVVEPCPDRGKGRSCELENRGRCPNQRLVVRLSHEKTLYKTCLYRRGRKIFDRGWKPAVGSRAPSTGFECSD